MRLAALLTVVSLVAEAQAPRFQRFASRTEPGRNTRGFASNSLAFFEFAPASGAGMGAACACTNPTGAKGETLNLATRASSAMCTKTTGGIFATTGIANGDLVSCGNNLARVEPEMDGTLSMLSEYTTKTNSLVRSQEIDDAAWTKGAAIGTITANYEIAPDNTPTADRYQYSSTTNDYIVQTYNVGGLAATMSVYLRGTSSSGAIDFCRGGAGSQCVVCNYVSTAWTRCSYPGTLATSSNVLLGCEVGTKGGACSAAGDVLVWGLQGELGSKSSYIPTVGAAAARAAEAYAYPGTGITSTSSMCATGTPTLISGSQQALISQDSSGADWWYLHQQNASTLVSNATTGGAQTYGSAAFVVGTPQRVCAYSGGTNRSTCYGTSCTTGVLATTYTRPATRFSIGSVAATAGYDGHLSRVCLDPDSTRCR